MNKKKYNEEINVQFTQVYIKITSTAEKSKLLDELKNILNEHAGMHNVILFYERDHRRIALSDKYKVKPEPKLFQRIESLLGKDTIKVK